MKTAFPDLLAQKMRAREQSNSVRSLQVNRYIDFSSNDYLGFAKSETLFHAAHRYLIENGLQQNGATGSRLISGNHRLFDDAEAFIAKFHMSESALIFNSGYDANVGFFSAVPQRNDVIIYDELCHASIRDGIRQSNAKAYKFPHNDLEAAEALILKHIQNASEIYIATESVFSMDGDSPNLPQLSAVSQKYHCRLVIDEAHALGVFGNCGEGLLQEMNLQDAAFARIITFGKGLGCHGAAIVGVKQLSDYLINFARSFIYTTGLPPHAVAAILMAYQELQSSQLMIKLLHDNLLHFNQEMNMLGLKAIFVKGKSAIKSAVIPGNDNVKRIEFELQQANFDVKAILSPTVPEGQERLRICLHSYNSKVEIDNLLKVLAKAIG